ncbi:deoxynucleoside triphosphate triphosphohydrolase SAMHD1 isoform X2 [Condylostylus longicornis]|uniref:deoxynucleoside triphosphate triphosphohydrolase SAMHD1 isoform X2 n=1 Tax=Condylostylus longicornis TaxID=2530218 RepID=UPI00244DA859|nr:deoxynucleoside triphosphate triphosphohydrolase SAMHD1 isoform X2 [Condylostylus longicornis]
MEIYIINLKASALNENVDDVIHGRIILSPLARDIIETKIFQRLKKVKQLGCTYMYFPEATHTRYEHCIGTYFLAEKMLSYLSKNVWIPEFYRTCVCIAGLLHDIGHGPFSHFWEEVCKKLKKQYKHEENSLMAVDYIFRDIRLSKKTNEHDFGVELIKAFIRGDKNMLNNQIDPKYGFLFEIICNEKCGIDVDKWDYLLRDYYHGKRYLSGLNLNMEFGKLFENARAAQDGSHIEFHRQNYNDIYYLFDARSKLHINLYQEPNVKIREHILFNAIKEFCKGGWEFKGAQLLQISCQTVEKFLHMTDDEILTALQETGDQNIKNWLLFLGNIFIKEAKGTSGTPIDIKIELGGEKMAEESIPFYGSPLMADNVKPMKGFYENRHYFKLSEFQ